VFLNRTLHASPGVIGFVFSVTSIGGLLGAVFAKRISDRVGSARIIWLSQAVAGPIGVLAAFAFSGWGVTLFAISMFAFSAASVVYNTAQVSYRQAVCPRPLLGRMNASVRFLVWGTLPLGGFAGGALGTIIGLRPTVFVCAIGQWAAVLWVVFSPLFGMRDVPLPQVDDVPADEATGVGAEELDHLGDVVGRGDVATPAGDSLADLVGDPAGVGDRWVHDVGGDAEARELRGR
jgi:MFS family permease